MNGDDESTLLNEFRKNFNKLSTSDKSKFYERDITRIQKDDAYALAFVHWKRGDCSLAVQLAKDCLTWRKENELYEFSIDSIGKNYVKQGLYFLHGRDRGGHRILTFLSRHHTKEAKDECKKLFIFWLERIQRAEPGEHITFILDAGKTGMANVDLGLIRFIIDAFGNYFPDMLERIIILDMPWLLNAVWNVVKKWMTEEQRQKTLFVTRKELVKYIDPEQLASVLGGTSTWKWSFPPFPDDLLQMHSLSDDPSSPLSSESEEEVEATTSLTEAAPLTPPPENMQSLENDKLDEESISGDKNNNTKGPKETATQSGVTSPLKRRHTTHVVVHRSAMDASFRSTTSEGALSTSMVAEPESPNIRTEEIKLRNLLFMSPVSELKFKVTDSTSKNHKLESFITLRNPESEHIVAYKIKTTSPERFHVKPSVGAIEPGAVAKIRVNLCAGFENTSGKDRFLVLYKDMEHRNPADISDETVTNFWKEHKEKDTRYEQKLRVKITGDILKSVEGLDQSESTKNNSNKIKKEKRGMKSSVSFASEATSLNEPPNEDQMALLKHELTTIRHKMTSIENDSKWIRHRFRQVLVVLVLLLLIAVYLMYQISNLSKKIIKTSFFSRGTDEL